MKWQNSLTTSFSLNGPSGTRKESTASSCDRSVTPAGPTVSRTVSPVCGSVEVMLASFPRMSGMNSVSQAHHAQSERPSTSMRCSGSSAPIASPQNPTMFPSGSRKTPGHESISPSALFCGRSVASAIRETGNGAPSASRR